MNVDVVGGEWSRRMAGLALVAAAGLAVGAPAPVVLSPSGAVWRYHDRNADLGTAWRTSGYEDAAWSAGAAPLGAGDGHFATTIDIGPPGGRFPTVYFRRTFSLTEAEAYEGLVLRLLRDDGAAVYLNGTLLVADGMVVPSEHGQYATQVVDGGNETAFFVHTAPATALVNGPNLLAVEVKQANPTSSDLGFDLELAGWLDETPPELLEVQPVPGSVVAALDFIRVLFDEGVQGVDAGDLLLNGQPATGLTFLSNREYSFTFAPPGTGTVQVAWAAVHGITDDSPRANPFGGGSWSYQVDPEAGDRPQLILSEFLALNANGLRDEDGTRSDWIEIYNPGPVDTRLEGWWLTDDPANLTSWPLPDVPLAVGDYLLVWASSKDRRDPARPLHANFSLGAGGEYLALVDARTNVVSAFAPTYPPQRADVSYGRDRADPTRLGYFLTPTPGAPNAMQGAGFAEAPTFSLPSGVYAEVPVTLTLTAAPGTTLRRTVDGSVPTAASPLYTGPIRFSTNLMIKVRAFPADPALFPSPVVSRTYLVLDASVRAFSSKLPLVVLSTPGRSIPQDVPPGQPRQAGTLLVVDTFRGRSALTAASDYQGWAEFEIFGQTSSGFPKRPYRIELQNELREEAAASLLGLPADGDWRLRNPYSDKCLMNDFLGQELFEAMGRYAVRRRLVEVFVNTSGDRLMYPRDYQGVMVLLENIERGADRVDIARLTPAHTQEPEISGGYIWKKDKDSPGDLNFSTSGGGGFGGQLLKVHEPKPRSITPGQLQWLRSYLNRMEQALYAANWRTATGANHYSAYLDPDSLVDQHWIVEYTKQIDGYRLSNYLHKDRGGRVKMEPIWDWNLAFGNADYLDGGRTNGWYYALLDENAHLWLRRLINGTPGGSGTSGDPDFNQRIADRWSVLRTNAFSSERVLARIQEIADLLGEAAERDFARFPRLGSYVWPNPNGRAGGWHVNYVTPTTYAGIISEMKQWMAGRYHWIDAQFTPVPRFNHAGGAIPPGFALEMRSVPGATIYYTLDGSDPRASGGGVAAGAMAYGGPVVLERNVQVRARARGTGSWQNTWSGPAQLALHTQVPALRVTELMYHPAPTETGEPDAQAFEFLEVKNVGADPLELRGIQFTQGIRFTFPALVLAPGQRAVVVSHRAAFESRYGTGILVAGEYEGRLDNAGERITLIGAQGEPIQDFRYDAAWQPLANGLGFSLVVADETAPGEAWGQPSGWRLSSGWLGSPGRDDPAAPIFPAVRVEEVLTRPTRPDRDAIELFNPGPGPADVGGWFLTDAFRTPKKFRIPAGTMLPAGGYRVFTADEFGGANPGIPFGLSAEGEAVYVFSGNEAGELTGYGHGFEFGGAGEGVTFGRHVVSTGEEHFVAQVRPTLGGPNAGPRVGPVVLSEIMYQPSPVFANGAFWNNTEDEYVVLFNLSAASVGLGGWRLHDGIRFDFPEGLSLPAGGSLVVVAFDPVADPSLLAAFRARFAVPAATLVLGPFAGNLDNAGETVSLSRPEEVLSGDSGEAELWILVDQVHYGNRAPWPESPAGQGEALLRWDAEGFGHDPVHWLGASPRPGTSPWEDGDGDGLPDLWELRHGLDPRDAADAAADADGDGLTNRDEHRAGTDPRDPDSRLGFDRLQVAEGVTLEFRAVARRGYAIEYREALAAGDWQRLATVPPRGEDRRETVFDPDQARERYYRLFLVEPGGP